MANKRTQRIERWVKRNQGKHFCLCGCGTPIEVKKKHYNA